MIYRSYQYFDEALSAEDCHFWAKPKAIQEAYGKVGGVLDGAASKVGKFIPSPFKNFGKPIANQGVIRADTAVNTISEILPDNRDCTEQTCTVLGLNTFEFEARGVFFVGTNDKFPYCGKNKIKNIK